MHIEGIQLPFSETIRIRNIYQAFLGTESGVTELGMYANLNAVREDLLKTVNPDKLKSWNGQFVGPEPQLNTNQYAIRELALKGPLSIAGIDIPECILVYMGLDVSNLQYAYEDAGLNYNGKVRNVLVGAYSSAAVANNRYMQTGITIFDAPGIDLSKRILEPGQVSYQHRNIFGSIR